MPDGCRPPPPGAPSLGVVVRILLVEDDTTVREAVAAYLTRAGHDVDAVADGESAVEHFTARPADLVLLDLMLPGLGGLEVTRRLRSMRRDLPLIMVTARGQEHERVQGLQHGADDYVTKPFSLRELELRVRSVVRRTSAPSAAVAGTLTDGDLELDLGARSALRGGAPLQLTAREFDLLAWFLAAPRRRLVPGPAHQGGVGLGHRRPLHGHRPRAAGPREGRARPRRTEPARHRLRPGLPLGRRRPRTGPGARPPHRGACGAAGPHAGADR